MSEKMKLSELSKRSETCRDNCKKMGGVEYFFDATADSKIFLKKAKEYLFIVEYETKDYQLAKKFAAGYNFQNEKTKCILAREEDIMYLIIKDYCTIERDLCMGYTTFRIG